MWLVIFSQEERGNEANVQYALYDSIEKAKAGGILLMDRNTFLGKDWRKGCVGLGQEDEDEQQEYYGVRYYPDDIGAGGGILVSNEDSDCSTKVSVSINRMQVNPQIQPPRVYEDYNDVEGVYY
jgi:hypothetical protein